ncbi:MAG: glutamine amidotransferase [Parasphingorhabdus sp.]|jgi:glutamine amidotransferase
MCRALLYLGSRTALDGLLFKSDNSLVRQVSTPRMLSMLNLAGFGMKAWDRESQSPEQPYSYSTDWIPVFDQNLKSLSEKVSVNCLLAHVRGVPVTAGETVSPKNNHPFCYPGCRITLAHNGDLTRFAEMKAHLVPHIKPAILGSLAGTTDSEWIYALLLSQLDEPSGTIQFDEIKPAIESVFRIIRDVRATCGIDTSSSVNLFITDGESVVAVRYCFNFGHYPIDSPESVREHHLSYLSLWYTLGRDYGCHAGEWQTIGGSESADTVIISSEPLTEDISTWVEVPEYGMLCARTGSEGPVISLDYLDI